MTKVYVLFQTDGYHPSVKQVFADKADAYALKDKLDKDEEFQLRVFNKLYVCEYDVK